MYLSVNWLKQFLPELDNDEAEDIAQKMSTSLTEVETVFNIAKDLDLIVAGEITEIVKHPKLDKIQITTIKTDTKEHQVLCGAKNIKVGNIVPLCLPGGRVYGGVRSDGQREIIKIEEKEMGGIKSEGMICSAKELGIGEDHTGIYVLPDDTKIGEEVDKLMYDTVIEIENKGLTHRPDCFSHIGIAREIAVQNKMKFLQPEHSAEPIQTSDLEIEAEVLDTESCKRYSIITISDIEVKDSPLWLKLRLMAAGMRPINNIVDISNYIMLETGQPSHIFDYDKISGNKLTVRKAKEGEEIITLDGEKRILNSTMLVNADQEKALGVAGVMGGNHAEVSATTRNIIIQVENFEMFNIRRTTRKLGLRSEASSRFEKGIDPEKVLPTMYKLVQMIQDLSGGEIASEVIDIYPNKEEQTEIKLNIPKLTNFLGIQIENKEIFRILINLGIEVESWDNIKDDVENISEINLKIPSFRRDLTMVKDIYEEIIRIYGYENVDFQLPTRNLNSPNKNKRFHFEKDIIRTLAGSGSSEVYSYAFVGEELYQKARMTTKSNLKLKNPLSPELTYMRDTIIPSLLEKITINQTRFVSQDIFEVSKTALKGINEDTGLHAQPKLIAGIINETESSDNELFRKAKGKLLLLSQKLNIPNINFNNLNGKTPFPKANIFHPNKSALIYSDDKQIGIIGYTHPEVVSAFGLKNTPVIYEINFDLIFELQSDNFLFRNLINLPTVSRDISFWVDEKVESQDMIDAIKSKNIDYLESVKVKDIYRNKNKENQKSITIEIILQPTLSTLKEDEISKSISLVETSLEETFKLEIREK